jgi:hypothetical protein
MMIYSIPPDMWSRFRRISNGLRFEHPFSGESGDGPAMQFRAGGTYNHIEIEDPDGDIVADSGLGLGWEIGTGVTLPLTGNWRVSPGLRYRALSRDVTIGSTTTGVDLRYVALELGFTWGF